MYQGQARRGSEPLNPDRVSLGTTELSSQATVSPSKSLVRALSDTSQAPEATEKAGSHRQQEQEYKADKIHERVEFYFLCSLKAKARTLHMRYPVYLEKLVHR